jgi:hypothetical protein
MNILKVPYRWIRRGKRKSDHVLDEHPETMRAAMQSQPQSRSR